MRRISKNEMFLYRSIGDGTISGKKVAVSMTGSSLIVEIDGERTLVTMEDIVRMVLEFSEKESQ
jgi:hypothetical protein